MTDTPEPKDDLRPLLPPRPPRPPFFRRAALGTAIVGSFAVGAAATTFAQWGRQPVIVPMTPSPISAMKDGDPMAVKGQVAEIFGNKFILADDSGRALIETGRAGEGGALVGRSETVTVQGRFEHGFVHSIAIQHGDGKTTVLGPPGPPPPPHRPFF